MRDSELVRVRWPRRSESRGRSPSALSRCSSFWVPSAAAAKTTCSAVKRLRRRTPRGLRLGPAGVDAVAAASRRAHPGHRRQRMDLGAVLLGEVEVVLDQGVLRVVAAPGHALAAVAARAAAGPGAAEVRVGHLVARLLPGTPKKTPDRRRAGRCRPRPSRSATFSIISSAGVWSGFVDDAEHPLGLVEVRRQLGLPVGDVSPGGVRGRRRRAARTACWRRPANRRRPRRRPGSRSP